MKPPVIEVRGLSKSYQLGSIGATTLRESLARGWRGLLGRGRRGAGDAAAGPFWALEDVSFDVAEGEVLGIVGRNGAGKSTLLKILSRITEPSRGEITLRGRVASLLEVGTGFHPELTGRENVFLNGAILGMKKREIDRKFDEIVAFAGVEKFIDTPVKRYSSGMSVRLAFAVAAHLEPEILIVDEVLAVGDAAFQRRCLDKMRSVTEHGRTVLFVSHNLGAVSRLCTRALLIHEGRLVRAGDTDEIVRQYLGSGRSDALTNAYRAPAPEGAPPAARIASALAKPAGRRPGVAIACGDSVEFTVDIELPHPTADVKLGIGIDDEHNTRLITAHPDCDPGFRLRARGRSLRLVCQLERLGLVAGSYGVTLLLMVERQLVQKLDCCMTLEIGPGDFFGNAGKHFTGTFLVDQRWSDASPAAAGSEVPMLGA